MDGLRDYQEELLKRAEDALHDPEAGVMLQLPTGGGKTHIAGALLASWLRGGRKAVWLTHRTELAEQTRRMLSDAGVSAIDNLSWRVGNPAPDLPNGVVILMAQTVGRRTNTGNIWGRYGSGDLLVIDEAHHATAAGWERAIGQWPGRVIGLTATPWRLSHQEGFNHLFGGLYCGPQVSQLQADGWLCRARVLMPEPEEIIHGGAITANGDYSESEILKANQDHPDIMTAGAFQFWQSHATERQTIIYAISKGHAGNLTAVFNDAGITAAAMLSNTPSEERAGAIESFGNGTLRVLVNVAVATEGFDLPDASCIVITRPTMSLALYLQMVGRGLRPKPGGQQDCLILDLAANAGIHGLPEENRQWSLLPRGNNPAGDAPVVRCGQCSGVSPAASHVCMHCDAPLGKSCRRCGKWRATTRWLLAEGCAHQHEIVCDLCHLDAHVKADLPVSRELKESGIDPLLFTLVDEVRRNLLRDNTRERELNELIAQRVRENSNDDADLEHLFDAYISSLSVEEQPASNRAIGIMWNSWETQRQGELDGWNQELSNSISKSGIEDKVRRECWDQLEQTENRTNIFEGLKVGELVAKIEEFKRDNRYFLLKTLDAEERERIHWQSQWDELGLIAKFRANTNTGKDNRRFLQLTQEVDRTIRRRLRSMMRQFEAHWTEIWADYQ